jgi:hypothetical protein
MICCSLVVIDTKYFTVGWCCLFGVRVFGCSVKKYVMFVRLISVCVCVCVEFFTREFSDNPFLRYVLIKTSAGKERMKVGREREREKKEYIL